MKKIGIVGWNTGENSFGVTKAYLNWLSSFGDVEILTPKRGIVADLDLLILPGGADIAPQSHNSVPGYYTGNTDVMKQFFFDNNLNKYIEAGIPIFGICLGFQQLSSRFGGKLIQHFPYEYSSKSRQELVDDLTFNPNSSAHQFFTSGIIPKKKYSVNSIHHQGCHELPENIEVLAISQDRNIEIARFAENIFGTQYHPEEIFDEVSTNIIKYLLKI